MPIGFLTAAERDRLNRFPAQIPDDDLFAFFQLSEADHTAINQQREEHPPYGQKTQTPLFASIPGPANACSWP